MESQRVQKFLCDHKTIVPLLSFKNVLLNFKPFHSISRLKTFIVFKRSIITSNFSILVSNTFSLISSSIVRNVEKKVFYLYQEDMEAPYYVRDILKLSKKTRIREQFEENSSRHFFPHDTRNYFHEGVKPTTRCVQTSNHCLIQRYFVYRFVVVVPIVTWHRYSQPDRTKGRVTSRKKNYHGTHPTRSAAITRTWTYTGCFRTGGTSRRYIITKIKTLRRSHQTWNSSSWGFLDHSSSN